MVQHGPIAKKKDEGGLDTAFDGLARDDLGRSRSRPFAQSSPDLDQFLGENAVSPQGATSPSPQPAASPNIATVQTQVRPWLDSMSDRHLSITQIEDTVHRAIDNDPKLRRQLKRALEAGGQEALKTIFAHPLVRISSAAVKAWVEEDGVQD